MGSEVMLWYSKQARHFSAKAAKHQQQRRRIVTTLEMEYFTRKGRQVFVT